MIAQRFFYIVMRRMVRPRQLFSRKLRYFVVSYHSTHYCKLIKLFGYIICVCIILPSLCCRTKWTIDWCNEMNGWIKQKFIIVICSFLLVGKVVALLWEWLFIFCVPPLFYCVPLVYSSVLYVSCFIIAVLSIDNMAEIHNKSPLISNLKPSRNHNPLRTIKHRADCILSEPPN